MKVPVERGVSIFYEDFYLIISFLTFSLTLECHKSACKQLPILNNFDCIQSHINSISKYDIT
jgi:hypothetical protein